VMRLHAVFGIATLAIDHRLASTFAALHDCGA
jgi:hypothetical protein